MLQDQQREKERNGIFTLLDHRQARSQTHAPEVKFQAVRMRMGDRPPPQDATVDEIG